MNVFINESEVNKIIMINKINSDKLRISLNLKRELGALWLLTL